mmetsp:Transcript_5272/g.7222  ORF Transcript_5272/g.7222 Transcript_5272/m.7222 type:complete len:357 (-) Transcript_5272:82-1152(-)
MSAYAMPESFFQTAIPCPPAQAISSSNNAPSPPLFRSDVNCKVTTDTAKEVGQLYRDPSICAGGELGVTVNSARVDHARLIKAVSQRSSAASGWVKNSQFDTDTTYVTSDDDDENDSYFCRTVPDHSSQSAHSDKHSENNYQEAIQFELSISFNGRKYTATRTLPRFEKLRNDLIAEMKKAAQRARRRTTMRNRQHHMAPNTDFDDIHHNNPSDSDTDVDSDSDDPLEGSTSGVTIPVLPVDHRDSSGTMSSGSGFTMLHAAMKEYCPAIERWLRHVADLVPPNSSPSLTNFLWEPLGSEDASNTDVNTGSLRSRNVSTGSLRSRRSTLNSIDEASDDEDGFDGEENISSWTSEEI